MLKYYQKPVFFRKSPRGDGTLYKKSRQICISTNSPALFSFFLKGNFNYYKCFSNNTSCTSGIPLNSVGTIPIPLYPSFFIQPSCSGISCVRACLKKAFCKMCVTICGRFCPDEGVVAGYGNRIRAKYTAKWGVQIAGMIFQTRSSIHPKFRTAVA